jgi:hypothetical protein
MPGRPPKPTNLLELSGAYRKNPQRKRAREGEPQPPALPVEMPAKFLIFHPAEGYLKAEKLRSIWDNCMKMWPWITFSDRDALEDYCRLKLMFDEGRKMSGAEMSAMIRIRSELGGTGSGRARLGVKAAGQGNAGAQASTKAEDPRAAYLARKFG